MTSSSPTPKRDSADQLADQLAAQQSAVEHRVQVAAAKLRTVLDERLGRTTPPNVKKLAQEDF